MDAQKTGQLIAEARKEKGLTQRELAQALHVSAQAVSKWERGLNFPDLALLEPLGDCLGLSVSELLSGARGEQPREELLRDSLRIFPAQTGAKVRRWRALALVCLGVLLILALCGGYRYVKYHTELLPQAATVISPIARSELDTLAFQTAGLPSVYLYDLTVADGAEHYQVQMEYWTAAGLVGGLAPPPAACLLLSAPVKGGGCKCRREPGRVVRAGHFGGGTQPGAGLWPERPAAAL